MKPTYVPLSRFAPDDNPLSSPSPPPPTIERRKKRRGKTRRSLDSAATDSHVPPPTQPVQSTSIPVPTQHRDNAQRLHSKHRRGAYRRLGLTPDQMQGVPRISQLFAQAEGGLCTVLAALRLCDDEEAGKFLQLWDRTSDSDLEFVSVEEVCVAAGVAPKRLLELAVSALVEDSRSAGAIIAASYHPRVIRATAENAIRWPDNQSDRKLFLSGTGYLPQPANRGPHQGVFNVVIQNNQNALPVGGEDDGAGTSDDPSMRFNAAEDDLKALHEVIDGNRLLDAPKVVENASAITLGHTYHDAEEIECIPKPKSSSA